MRRPSIEAVPPRASSTVRSARKASASALVSKLALWRRPAASYQRARQVGPLCWTPPALRGTCAYPLLAGTASARARAHGGLGGPCRRRVGLKAGQVGVQGLGSEAHLASDAQARQLAPRAVSAEVARSGSAERASRYTVTLLTAKRSATSSGLSSAFTPVPMPARRRLVPSSGPFRDHFGTKWPPPSVAGPQT